MINFIGIENNFTHGFAGDLYPWLMTVIWDGVTQTTFCLESISAPFADDLAQLAADNLLEMIASKQIELAPVFKIGSLYHAEGASLNGKAAQLECPEFASRVRKLILAGKPV